MGGGRTSRPTPLLTRSHAVRDIADAGPAVVLSIVFGTLLLTGVLVPFFGPEGSTAVASHTGHGSFAVYLRFVVLATVYAGVVLAAVVAVSAVVSSARTALTAVVGLVVLLTVGVDLGLVGGLSTGLIGTGSLRYLQALGPNGAFRGLVLVLVVRTVDAAAIPASAVVSYVLGLFVWLVGSLLTATWLVWERPTTDTWSSVESLDEGAESGRTVEPPSRDVLDAAETDPEGVDED